jgi:predicted SprT family Zn-dependent metalloprotease
MLPRCHAGVVTALPPVETDPSTPETLRSWAERYARRTVSATDLAVDLSLVEWDVSKRAKRRAGAVLSTPPPGAEVGVPLDWTETPERHRRCTVRLTWAAHETHGVESTAAVLRHELVHVEQVQRFGRADHGPAFRERAVALEAPRHCEPFTPARYLLYCRECGDVTARRHRRSKPVRRPDRYRSGCCSAPLAVEERDPDG